MYCCYSMNTHNDYIHNTEGSECREIPELIAILCLIKLGQYDTQVNESIMYTLGIVAGQVCSYSTCS